MISIIVPVYNVEPYLRKCLDSIVGQKYSDLEILVIDDGSTDESGAICDEYAKKDSRIRVFHTSNFGLSAARNLGVENARGDYLGFVDSDDWIEPDMYEALLNCAEETKSDVSCCGYYRHYSNKEIERPITSVKSSYEGEALIPAAMKVNVFGLYAWNKLYKRCLFNDCMFPQGMLFEDIATIWRILVKCGRVSCVPNCLYHYNIRKNSLGNTKSMKNFADRWIAFRDRYYVMAEKSEELRQICTKGCLDTIGYTWRWLHTVDKEERKERGDVIQEMRSFAIANRKNMRLCSIATRISLFCAIHSCSTSIFICYYLNQAYRRFRGMNQMV